MGHQLGPFVLPVPIGARAPAGDVCRSHIRSDGGSLQLGPVLGQQAGGKLTCYSMRTGTPAGSGSGGGKLGDAGGRYTL